MGKNLKIYIDESGDFGVKRSSADLLVISCVAVASDKDISTHLSVLELKLRQARYSGMIHVAPLVNKRNNSDYNNFGLGRRRAIYWALFHFMLQSKLKAQTFIIDKSAISSGVALRQEANRAVSLLHQDLRGSLSSFDKIEIYYDGGQPILKKVLHSHFTENCFEIIENFNHMDRVFQVADMLTFTDKMLFKREHDVELTDNERRFFTDDDIRFITKLRRTQEF